MKPRFSFRLWRWTSCDESLFSLAREELEMFKLIVQEALV